MEQPNPVANERPHIADLVIEDVRDRKATGIREYGTALQSRNGRRALWDLYEELLDGAAYARQRIDEEDRLLAQAADDPSVRSKLLDVYNRARRMELLHPNDTVQALTGDIYYLRTVVESLLVALAQAADDVEQAEMNHHVLRDRIAAVTERTPIGYQYRAREEGDSAWKSYDESYLDEEYTLDRSNWLHGFYPEARPVYGGAWFRVDFDNPPPENPREFTGMPLATETHQDAPNPPGTPTEPQDGAVSLHDYRVTATEEQARPDVPWIEVRHLTCGSVIFGDYVGTDWVGSAELVGAITEHQCAAPELQ